MQDVLSEHINAEIVSGTITNKQNCMDYLTWTYFFRRITKNPLYYNVEKADHESIQKYLMNLIDSLVDELKESKCVESEDNFNLIPTFNGYLASYYYIQHKTIKKFGEMIQPGLSIYSIIKILASAEEYKEVPVRHNEDQLNEALANICPYPVDRSRLDEPKTKTILLYQAYFSHLPLPIRDYITDTKLVLDNCVRFIQSMVDMTADRGYLDTLLNLMQLSQMITQGVWIDQSCLVNLPGIGEEVVEVLAREGVSHLCQLIEVYKGGLLDDFLKACKIKIQVSLNNSKFS